MRGDSLTRPRLDIFGHRSARGGGILLLAPGWTSLVVVQRVVGRFSYSLGRDISGRHSARGGEILLLAPGWTSFNVRHVVAGDREQRTYIEIASKRERGREPKRKSRDLNNRSLKTDKETESGGPT